MLISASNLRCRNSRSAKGTCASSSSASRLVRARTLLPCPGKPIPAEGACQLFGGLQTRNETANQGALSIRHGHVDVTCANSDLLPATLQLTPNANSQKTCFPTVCGVCGLDLRGAQERVLWQLGREMAGSKGAEVSTRAARAEPIAPPTHLES